MRRAALALVAIAWPAHAGPCRQFQDLGFLPDVLTPDGATLDARGGVVIAAESVRLQRAIDTDASLQDWRFGAGGKHELGKRAVIAPGLVVVAPTVLAADLELENADSSPALGVHYRADAKVSPLAAPKLTMVTYRDHNLGSMTSELTVAKLSAAPPSGAVALVAYAGDTPRSWAAISTADGDELTLYAVDHCVLQIPGTIATRAGDRITLAWLDDTGHLGARTRAIEVRR
ncbi:MAG TPA: hypothetical protein VGF94_09555 [Kofleriaceae bacterium]